MEQTLQPHDRETVRIHPASLLVEELINGGKVWTVMVRCLFGAPIAVGVAHSSRPAGHQNYYTTDWQSLQRGELEDMLPPGTPPPSTLQHLLRLSSLLSAPFEFVRVDFMLPDLESGPIYFGELTFSPAAGLPVFTPANEAMLGALWKD